MKIGFIGAGRVGCGAGRMLSEKGFEISYYSKNYDDALFAAEFTGGRAFESPKELTDACGMVFVTTPDGEIRNVWNEIKDYVSGTLTAHMSGAMSADEAFPDAEKYGARVCSVHPLLAVSDRERSYLEMADAFYTIEGSAAEEAKRLFEGAGLRAGIIDKNAKARYHAAAAMASNLVLSLLEMSCEIFEDSGLPESDAKTAPKKLVLGNINSIFEKGFEKSLTGPLERGDAETIKKHLDVLTGDAREAYIILSRHLLKTAKRKNPDRDYNGIAAMLNGG